MTEPKNSFSSRVMATLKEEGAKPLDRSHFVKRQIILWLTVLVMIFVGGHSLGVLIYFAADFDFRLLELFLKTPEKAAVLVSILAWMILLGFGFHKAIKTYRSTKRGYRLETPLLVSLLTLALLFVGNISYRTEIAPKLDQVFGAALPIYQPWEVQKLMLWTQPEEGFLAGTISSIGPGTTLYVTDATGQSWHVTFLPDGVRGRVQLQKDEMVKLVGRISGEGFIADEIRPWRGLGKPGRRRPGPERHH